jgi:23S rRNA pseudouridine1911/1915/1917 synthase
MSSESKDINKLNKAGEREASSPFFSADDDLEKSADVRTFDVSGDMEGHRLDFFVSRSLGISRNSAQALIRQGAVSLSSEERVKPSVKVPAGARVSVMMPEAPEVKLEPEDVPFEVVYSDGDIIVVNKPAGLIVHPAPGYGSGTLVNGLLFRFPDLVSGKELHRPGIVHRLDRTTSGLMVVARNGLAMEFLFKDFKMRRVGKEYLALCMGKPKRERGSVSLPIGRDPSNRTRMTVIESGRPSLTDYRVIWSFNGFSLVRCTLHSGRMHQIRVHMKALNCPLVGDRVYAPNARSPFKEERIFLHSWRLSFTHPRTRKRMEFRSVLPPELTAYLREVLSKEEDRQT